ncbi:serine protease [Microbacterium sp. CSI-V]|uniref:S1C family serine protease n=1 Tax=unclassified Microbacterium TaxID=2609290 RepID=UPI00097BABDE|nr:MULTISPECIES: trypsin-like peptidase domain-containing protein [unclassified Microbacterium]MXS73724.1 PDZ domain-containing protein [Microbacterium sp. TL13]ONI62352.1 serine protease [Microbacterium sp. CSI-V]
MSDTTDDRPEDNRPTSDAAAQGAVPASHETTPAADATPVAPAAESTPAAPPVPTRSPADAAAAWPPPAQAPAAGQAPTASQPAAPHQPTTAHYGTPQNPAPHAHGYASAPSGATTPTGQAFGPAATGTYGTHPTLTLPESEVAKPRKKSSGTKIAALLIAAALVGGGAGLGGTYAGLALWGGSNGATASGPTAITVNDPSDVNATAAVAAKVVPSVVTISATAGTSGGTGSGVILSDDGYVLTNTHVVTLDGQSGNTTLSVTTSDGRVYAAKLVGTDPTYDLAVIKLENASNLTPIEWADSSKLNVGDNTIAVGAPLGLANTVTTGIVSALNRSIEVASSAAPSDSSDSSEGSQGGQGSGESPFFFDFGQGQQSTQTTQTIKIAVIQTDAAINPGNSGGALVDDEGKLIGINVAIASAGSSSSSSGQSGNIGVGFSIPSDIAKRVSQEIIDNGSATHGLLGASVQDAASIQGATTTGAYVAEVTAGGAAQAGGLQKGDVITEFNGIPVTSSVDLTAQVRALAAGSEATVTYLRGGKQATAQVTLGSMPAS